MLRRLFALAVAAVVAVAAFSVGPLANPQSAEASCSQAKIIVWEHHSYVGDGLVICYAPYGTAPGGIPNLADVTFYGSGGCEGGNSSNWNNCISSGKFYEGSVNTSVCLYTEPGYIGEAAKLTGGSNWQFSWGWLNWQDNTVSSIKFGC